MRIAMFADNNYPELSGITDTMLITGRELIVRGHDVLLVGPRYSPADYAVANRYYPPIPEEDVVHGIRFVRLPSLPLPFSPTGQSRLALPIGASYSALHEFRPDIIHTHSPYGLGWEARNAAQRFNVPLVGTNHTAIEDFFPVERVMRKFDAWYYNHCDFVTAPYEKLLSRMREYGFSKPGHAVPNPVELGIFSPPSEAERAEEKRALKVTGPVLLYVGRLAAEKRIDVLVRALPEILKAFPTLTLVMTGRGAAENSLRSLAKELGVESQVLFTGFLSTEALAKVYNAADVFGFMSTSDSQSIALMQAYASGMPAVCARARGLPDYTPSDIGFLVEPNDHAQFAQKVIELLEDPALRARMGAAALEFVKKLSPAHIADQWEKIYSDALSSRSASSSA